MQERAIHISSADRQKIGKNKVEDVIIKFDPVLKLQNTLFYYINTNKIPGELSSENLISSHVKITCYLHM